MALQKIKESILFNKGLDTKTNPQITDGFLELENCELNNLSAQKTKGLTKISEVSQSTDIAYPINVFETQNQLEIIYNNQVSEYDPLSSKLFARGQFDYLDRTQSMLIADDPIMLLYSEWGNYAASAFKMGTKYYIRVQNLKDSIVINTYEITKFFHIPATEYPVGLVATSTGLFLYGQEVAGGIINEYYYPYDEITPFLTSLNIIATAQNVVPTISPADDSFYPPFVQNTKTISTEFDGGNIWIFFVNAAGNPLVLLRNLSGQTIPTTINTATGLGAYQRKLSANNFAPANLCSTFYNKSTINVGGTEFNSVIFCIFQHTIIAINVNTQKFIGKFDQPDLANKNYVQSMCVLQNNNYLVLLKEDLREYNALLDSPSSSYPYTIYNLLDGVYTWGRTDATKTQPFNYTYNADERGQGFVTGSLWATPDNVYFSVMAIPNVKGDQFDVNFRHGNYYIIDWNYNLVEFSIHYNGSKLPLFTNQKSVPTAIVESKPNLVTNRIGYTMIEDVQSIIRGGTITFSNQALIFDFGLPALNPKIVSYDRGKTGYFGFSNMYMATQANVEYSGFLDFPICKAFATAAPPPPTTNKFWTYAVTFEYVNKNNELVRSSPSVFASVEVSTLSNVNVYYTYPSALESKNPIIIRIWRTTVNAQTFYLLADITYVPGSTASFYVDPFTADTTLVKNELAYFSGGVLGELPFEPFKTFVSHQNTIYAVNLENPNRVQFSLPQQRTVALATAFGFDFDVESRGGPIVELASLDSILVIFKEELIYGVEGNPPDALGNNNSLTIPTLITSPVGCSEKASVIRIPQVPGVTDGGILFKSKQGIYLLDRSLRVNYLGAAVERYNNLTILNATLSQTENKVRYTTTEGTIITYDYFYNTWAIETGINLVGTTVYQDKFVGINTSGEVFQIFDGYYKNNKPYSMKIGSPWIKLAGIQGYQRIYKAIVLGDFKATSVLKIGISYDYVDIEQDWLYYRKDVTNSYGANFPIDNASWGILQPWGGSELSNYQVQVNIPRQKCESLKFTFYDEFDNIITDTGNSFTLSEITIVVGIKSESVKLPVSRRV